MSSIAYLQKAYLAYFGRPVDATGIAAFGPTSTATDAQVNAAFFASPESQALYGTTFGVTQINAIYQMLFGRQAEPAGLAYWANEVARGALTPAAAAIGIMNGALNADATAVTNKLAASAAYQAAIDTTPEILAYVGDAAAATARAFLATVTTTAPTAAAIDSNILLLVANTGAGSGTTYTLTTAIDNIPGTAGNDTIIASDTTLNAADQINGGAGVDTLKIFAGAGAVTMGQLSNIENVYVNAGTSDINVSAIAGVTSLTIDAASAARTYTVSNQAITLQNDKTVQGGTLKFGAADTAANVTVSTIGAIAAGAITAGAVDVNAGALVATLNLTATGASNFIALTNTAAGLKTLNVLGDKLVTVTSALAGLKTVNASANTAGVTFDQSGLAADNTLTFTGGAGNDKVIIKAGFLLNTVGVADVLDGGAGTDTLVMNDVAPVYAAINAAKNFEILGINTTGSTIDLAQITNGINQFSVGSLGTTAGALTETFNNSLSTTKYSIDNTAANTGTVTINNKVGESATTISLDNQSGAAKILNTLALVGATTVNLTSSGSTGSSNTITTLTNVENSNIVITGSTDLKITGALVGAVTGSKVDASAFTGKLTVTGSGVSDIIIGGTAADTIVTGTGADVVTLGGGADKLVYNGTVAAVFTDSLATTAGMDKITDFVAGTDKIALVNTGVAVTSVVLTAVTVATAADVATLLTAIGNQVAATVGAAEQVGLITVTAGAMAGTYLLANDLVNAAAATDMLINITGVSGTVTAADFVFA